MRFAGNCLVIAATLLLTLGGAQAAGPQPARKAATPERTGNCDAYGPGFVRVQGTDTCIKVGGRVRVESWYTPGKNAVTSGAASSR